MSTNTIHKPAPPAGGVLDPIGADLTRALKALKLGRMSQTLPERLALARQRKLSHTAFLELILDDEITRREATSAHLRARTAGLDASMRIETWDELDDISYDRQLLMDLTSLRFTEAARPGPRPARPAQSPRTGRRPPPHAPPAYAAAGPRPRSLGAPCADAPHDPGRSS